MISQNEHIEVDKKKVLKKVRTNFLSKRPEIEEHTLVPVPKPVNPYKMQMISGGWCLVEQNRNICMGLKYLNLCLDVKNVKIQDAWNTKQIVLRPRISNQACLVPWEYSVKRLESYGDLDLATLAHKMMTFNGKYEQLIGEYHRLIESGNRETIEDIEKARIYVREYRKKIESTYPFTIMKFIYNKNGVNLHSFTLNEAIVKEVGQSVEKIAGWAEKNGIPVFFNHETKLGLKVGKFMLSQRISVIPKVDEKPEVEDVICDMNGEKRKVVIQQVKICEPTEEGYLISWYVIVKSSVDQQNILGVQEEEKEECEQSGGVKWMKYENQAGTSTDTMSDKMTE